MKALAEIVSLGALGLAVTSCGPTSPGGAGGVGGSGGTGGSSSIRSVGSPPSYLGSTGGGADCRTSYRTMGHEPTAGGRYPLFLYFVGTGDPLDGPAPVAVTRAMAERGYAAFSAAYDNGIQLEPQSIFRKVACLYDPNRSTSLVGALCALPNVDCDHGIMTWGHSQGAAVAGVAASYDARVRGSWLTGLGQPFGARPFELTTVLPQSRVRFVNGANDGGNRFGDANHPATMNELTGRSCSASPCFDGPNGSGWYIVGASELAQNPADHCWFYKRGCIGALNLDPNWTNSDAAFSLGKNADWLEQIRRLGAIGAVALPVEFRGYESYTSLPTRLSGMYPAGVIDWGTNGAFTVSGPAAGVSTNHAFIGTNTNASEGTFTFWGPQGRTLQSLTVRNSGSANAVLTVKLTTTTQQVVTRSDDVAPGATVTFDYSSVNDVKTVSLASSNGNALRFSRIVVYGASP